MKLTTLKTRLHQELHNCVQTTAGGSWSKGGDLCSSHGCKTKIIKVTSKKWGYVETRKCYGWVTKKVSKVICPGTKTGTGQVEEVPNLEILKSTGLGEGGEVGRISSATEPVLGDIGAVMIRDTGGRDWSTTQVEGENCEPIG